MNTLNSWRTEDDEANWIPYSYQPNSNKSIKETEAQYSHRAKFSLANSILNLIRPIIKISFVKYNKGRKSGYNTAVGLFLTNAVRGDYPKLDVNFSAMEVSKGSLAGLYKWEFSVNANEALLIWDKEPTKSKVYEDDSVQMLLFNISKASFILGVETKRVDQKISYTIPATEKGTYVAWAFVTNRDNTDSSNTHFLGKFEIDIKNSMRNLPSDEINA